MILPKIWRIGAHGELVRDLEVGPGDFVFVPGIWTGGTVLKMKVHGVVVESAADRSRSNFRSLGEIIEEVMAREASGGGRMTFQPEHCYDSLEAVEMASPDRPVVLCGE